ncbi:MAG: HNH endonuclease [Burkholderiaceae bacterium]|nr:HNH endonuclease [Burkholderiaceae bacterium]
MSVGLENSSGITQSELKEIVFYDQSTGHFVWRKRFRKSTGDDVAGSLFKNGYVYIQISNKSYRAHRLAWLYVYGNFPALYLDHINGDRSDNRIGNLREVSCSENMKNQRIGVKNTSGYLNISWQKSRLKWSVGLKVNGKSINVGRFDSLDDAIKARNEAYIQYGFHKNHGIGKTKASNLRGLLQVRHDSVVVS